MFSFMLFMKLLVFDQNQMTNYWHEYNVMRRRGNHNKCAYEKGAKSNPLFLVMKMMWRPWPKIIFFCALTSCIGNLWPVLKLFAIASFCNFLIGYKHAFLKNKICTMHVKSYIRFLKTFLNIIHPYRHLIGILILPYMPIQKWIK